MQSVTRHVNNTSLQLFIFCLTWATKKIECQELKEQADSLVLFFLGCSCQTHQVSFSKIGLCLILWLVELCSVLPQHRTFDCLFASGELPNSVYTVPELNKPWIYMESKVHLSLRGLSSQGWWLNGTTLFDAKKVLNSSFKPVEVLSCPLPLAWLGDIVNSLSVGSTVRDPGEKKKKKNFTELLLLSQTCPLHVFVLL
jgi:hypothetical protein